MRLLRSSVIIPTMPPATSIPRFLLPLRSPLWSLSPKTIIRNASSKSKNNASKKPSKPLVLEKPSKFNPPSHPARIRKDPPRYPGPQLSAEEIARQSVKKYPNMMPPEGTFMHWFLNNKSIHIWIALVITLPSPSYPHLIPSPNQKSNPSNSGHSLDPRRRGVDNQFQTRFPIRRYVT